MNKGRIIVELSKPDKVHLELELKKRGQTISSWVSESIEEVIEGKGKDSVFEKIIQKFSQMNEPEIIKTLSHIDWAFTDAHTSSNTHGIHPYPAKFIPQIPYTLISALSKVGETVWDPFGGSGTTAFEALKLNRRAISTDINPIATLVGVTKTLCIQNKENKELLKIIDELKQLSENNELEKLLTQKNKQIEKFVPKILNIEKWFHKNAINELSYIRLLIQNISNKKIKTIAETTLSKIILKSSFQDGETRYASKPRVVKIGTVISYFVSELDSIRKKILRNSDVLKFKTAEFVTYDTRNKCSIPSCSVDLVVTSPPYPNSTDYHLYHRFRLFWLGHDPRVMAENEIGSHLRAQRQQTGIEEYIKEMNMSLKEIFRVLRPGKYAVLVVGSGVFDGVEYDTASLLSKEASMIGYDVVKNINRKVHDSKRSFVAFARRLKEEKILILKKPEESIDVHLIPAPYKLFPYENDINNLEISSILKSSEYAIKRNRLKVSPSQMRNLKRLTFIHGFEATNYAKERSWQAILENGDALEAKNRKDPKYVTHGLHEYKGKFYPQLAKSLFNIAGLAQGSRVLDPFCGSGTILLESYINGINASGLDLNPLAIKIARTKTDILKVSPQVFDLVLDDFLAEINSLNFNDYKNLKEQFDERILSELSAWFPKTVLTKLAAILKKIEDINNSTIKDFLKVCLSTTIRQVSQQEPRDLRIRRRKIEINDAPVKELFIKKIEEQRNRIFKFWSLENMNPNILGSAQINEGDSRDIRAFEEFMVEGGKFDAVITSPPYATALPYIDTDRLSLLVLFGLKTKKRQEIENALIGSREIETNQKDIININIENKDFSDIKSKTACKIITKIYSLNKDFDVGFRRKNLSSLIYRYYADMTKTLSNLDQVVKSKGSIFFVIGNNKTLAGGHEVKIESDKFLIETGIALGWVFKKEIPITVTQENRLHNKNSIKENSIIWFEKH